MERDAETSAMNVQRTAAIGTVTRIRERIERDKTRDGSSMSHNQIVTSLRQIDLG